MRFDLPSAWSVVFRCAATLLFISCSVLSAAEPQMSSVAPSGFQRGKEVELTINGTRLGDAKELLFFTPGITVTSLEASNETTVKIKATTADDLAPGIYAFRVRTATGVSNLKTITVGHLPDEKDVEPNNSFDKPQPATLNCTINGSIATEDSDFFQVELKQGDRLTAEIEGLRLGNTYFDPFIAIYDEKRAELARSDDAPLLHADSLCSIVAPADGKYLVLVRESAIGGGGGGYRLHLGSFPRPTAVFPPGGKPGETLQVRWIGDAAGDFTSSVTLPSDAKEASLFAEDARGRAPSPNVVRVNDLAATNEVEPNDAREQAAAGPGPGALNGIIERPGDIDHFRFTVKKGMQYEARVYSRMPFRSPLDSVLTILNDKGNPVGSNDDTGNQTDSNVRFSAGADGEYFAVIRDQLGNGGPNFVYRIEVTEVKPQLTVTVPERQQYISTTLVVPRNNRMAIMLGLTRAGVDGEVRLELPQVPPGVTVEALPLTPGRTDVPVLFTAAADANPSGAVLPVLAKSIDVEKPITQGHLVQRNMLVRSQNNNEVWGYRSDKLAAVVSNELPFKIEIVPPKAALPRNGSLDLKVVATRAPDFKAPIAISLVYNPPGVSSSVSAVIPEGANEGVIPITANAQAALGPWKFVAFGRSSAGNGNIECSSQFADVTIAESFYTITLPKSTVEIGKEGELTAAIEVKQPFEGTASVELKGLPNGVTAAPVEFKKDDKEVTIKLFSTPETRAGKYTTLVCVTSQKVEGETVSHTLANGELRVDPPLQAKGAVAAKPTAGVKKPASRLEQLRQEKK